MKGRAGKCPSGLSSLVGAQGLLSTSPDSGAHFKRIASSSLRKKKNLAGSTSYSASKELNAYEETKYCRCAGCVAFCAVRQPHRLRRGHQITAHTDPDPAPTHAGQHVAHAAIVR